MDVAEKPWHRDALPKGTLLHGFRIDGIIGRGGFGITYRAVDALDQGFAIKECFPRQFACRDGLDVAPTSSGEEEPFLDCRNRFVREAKSLVHLAAIGGAGDGVVKVMTFFEAHNTAYIVMELLRGQTLDDLIKDSPGGVPGDRLSELMFRVLHALGAVHDAGLLHRDVKPANIFLRENEHPVLIDFGAARTGSHGQTMTFTQVFSEGYAPIEQISGTAQGPTADIYAFGATFYKAIGGKAVDALARHQAVARDKPDPQPAAVEIGAGRYPESLLSALDAALRVAPEDRPQSAAALMALLTGDEEPPTVVRAPHAEAAEAGATIVAPGPAAKSPPRGTKAPAAPAARARWSGWHLIAGLAVLAVVGAGLYVAQERRHAAEIAEATAAQQAAEQKAATETAARQAAEERAAQAAAQASAARVDPQVEEANIKKALAVGKAALQDKNYAQAMSAFRQAADKGNAEAQLEMGYLYEYGLGVTQDYAEALRWYRKAADQGELAAERKVGFLYQNGLGIAQNYAEAMRWYRKSADHGNADALGDIGYLYRTGLGVVQDYEEAIRWYRKAADLGLASAQRDLGSFYANGLGVPKDIKQARFWNQKAAAGGDEMAKEWLAGH